MLIIFYIFFIINYNIIMKYDAIIIGGGITGLSIAYRFIDSYKKILLIESTGRLGGRVNTIKDKNGLIYEAGAGRISENHNKTLNLIEELGFTDQLIKLPQNIDYIIDNKKEKVDIPELIKGVLEEYKKIKDKIKIDDINFFQLCIDTIGFDKAELFKNVFGYDAEFMKMNARVTLDLFIKDYGLDPTYFILQNGLEQLIKKMETLVNKENYITIKKKEELLEIYDDQTILTDKDIYNFDNLIIAIPQAQLLKINIFQDIDIFESVEDVPLLRIYAKYPLNSDGEIWFKNINRTITNNYIRHIIPVNYENGLIMISYIDSEYAEMWNDSSSNSNIITERLHKEIKKLFNIEPPKPEYIKFYYWSNGLHVWKPGFNYHKLYKEIMKPYYEQPVFICGESFSKNQGWIEGCLETSYDVLEQLEIEDISFKRNEVEEENNEENIIDNIQINTKNDLYNIYDVIKNKTWIVIELDKKYIFDISNWIENQPNGKWDLEKAIEYNKYYIKDGTDVNYTIKPIQLFKKGNRDSIHKSKDIINKYFKQENEYVKQVGILI
jgi:protoporphyrinogen oxidase